MRQQPYLLLFAPMILVMLGEMHGNQGVIDSLLAARHVLEMFRRVLPHGHSRACRDRLSNRLTKIVSETRKLHTP